MRSLSPERSEVDNPIRQHIVYYDTSAIIVYYDTSAIKFYSDECEVHDNRICHDKTFMHEYRMQFYSTNTSAH